MYSKKLRQFDAYPKTLEDFRIKTFGGATVTIVSSIIMVILFMSELNYYLTYEVTPELFVDTSRGQKLKINIEVKFPVLPCAYLSIDAMDVSGEQQIDVDHHLWKQRIDLEGNKIDEAPEKEELGDESKNITAAVAKPLDPKRCESCYGAETKDGQCCNNCEDVREAYRKKGWAFNNPENIEQCEREGWSQKMKAQQNEGCLVYGYLEVNRVAGNFHFAPGKSFQQQHVHVHDLQAFGGQKFNLTHYIKHLSFGDDYPGIVNPLDNVEHIADKSIVVFRNRRTKTITISQKLCGGQWETLKSEYCSIVGVPYQSEKAPSQMMFQYYVKIVPTTYVKVDSKILNTNQYSVTKHSKVVGGATGESGLPGVFVIYEISPMMVKYTEKQRSFMHFLTGVCAIIGGVFTVAGIIDSMIYHSARALQKR